MKYLKTYKLFESDFDDFCFGDCEVYAIALHRLYGHPLYVVNGYYKEPDWDEEMGWTAYLDEPCHVVVKLPNGKYLDAQGETTEDELKKDCLFANQVEYIKIEPISEEEAKYLYSGEDQEDYIQEVINMIKTNESSTQNLKKIPLDIILDIQDFFIQIEDFEDIDIKKSYFDKDSEEWNDINDFKDLDGYYSIEIYTQRIYRLDEPDGWKMGKEELDDIVSAIERCYDYLKDKEGFGNYFDINIRYRQASKNLNNPVFDEKIEISDIAKLLNKDILSVLFTLHANYF